MSKKRVVEFIRIFISWFTHIHVTQRKIKDRISVKAVNYKSKLQIRLATVQERKI